ncbi:MAG TPA: restriction endonuclease [Candidatus Paceibacterota bacterium]
MQRTNPITPEYFQQYRQKLGFTNQVDAKNFFGAKDIVPPVDFDYLKLINKRLYEILGRINAVVSNEIKLADLNAFKKEYIERPFKVMKASGILPRLNNQGRRPEDVYFNWMRGFVISNFFLKALGLIFEIDVADISLIGDDDFKSIETFKRTPKADISINLSKSEKIRIEMQSGFAGINDIKQHKILEAKRVFRDERAHSLAIHIDLYNGQAAFVKLDEITDNDEHWMTRINLDEGLVYNIDQNFFFWDIKYVPPIYQHVTEKYYT